MFPYPKRRGGQSEEAYKKQCDPVNDARENAARCFRNGLGNANPSVQGTLWAAYNGITELVDHRTLYRDAWHRLESCWFGDAQRTKQRAYDFAIEMLAS